MKSNILSWIGILLLLVSLLVSEVGLHVLAKRIPIVSLTYRGWDEPEFYQLSREDSNAGRWWLGFLKLTGVVGLIGFSLVFYEINNRLNATQSLPGSGADPNRSP